MKNPVSKSKLKKITEYLKDKSDDFDVEKQKILSKYYREDVWDLKNKDPKFRLPDPYQVVVEFIKEKGLKLYGGQALHEHLKKYKSGFYKSFEFPDYDVFSPNAWEHAKELANRLFDLGFFYSEARSSILNDEAHQTYKVSIDLQPILDLTQMGCTPSELRSHNCDNCGVTKDGECFSLFNYVPANNLINYKPQEKPKIYTETYDFKNDKSLHPKKMFVCDPNWLKISMYRELSEPLANPARLPKVGKRLEIFNHFFEYNHRKCKNKTELNNIIHEDLKPVLKYIANFVKKNKLINFGASAYNLFVKNKKFQGDLNISDYEVYSGDRQAELVIEELHEKISKKFPNLKFNYQKKIEYWKEGENESYVLNVSKGKKLKYNNIITIVQNEICVPYVQYNGIRYVSVDRLKSIYFRAVALIDIFKHIEENPKNYECMLSNIIKIEKLSKKKTKNLKNRTKLRRYIGKCSGDDFGKIIPNLTTMWSDKLQTLKKTKYIVDAPKEGYITKIYEMPKKELKLPFRPSEIRIKSHRKYHRDISRKYKSKKN